MAKRTFTGRAAAVEQIETVQITAYDAATTYSLIVGAGDHTHTVSVTGTTDADGTAAALAAAFNDDVPPAFSDDPALGTRHYLAGLAATVVDDVITITGTAGFPFTLDSAVDGGTGTIGSPSQTQAPTGPHWVDNAANFLEAAAVGNNDTLRLTNTDVGIYFGLDQSSVTGVTVTADATHKGRVGLDPFRYLAPDGTHRPVPEYRETKLEITATSVDLSSGSGRIRLDVGASSCAFVVRGSAAAAYDGPHTEPVVLYGTATNSTVTVLGGRVGLALDGTVVDVGDIDIADGLLRSGPTLDLNGALSQSGGTGEIKASGAFTATVTGGHAAIGGAGLSNGYVGGGVLDLVDAAAVSGVLTCRGGVTYYDASGTCASLLVLDKALVDSTRTPAEKTFTAVALGEGGRFIRDPSRSTVGDLTMVNAARNLEISVKAKVG